MSSCVVHSTIIPEYEISDFVSSEVVVQDLPTDGSLLIALIKGTQQFEFNGGTRRLAVFGCPGIVVTVNNQNAYAPSGWGFV